MPLIAFPNVPQVAGVPQLLRQVGGPTVTQITGQFPGASGLLNQIDGVSDFLTQSPNATIQQLFDTVPGVTSAMSAMPGFSQILGLPAFASLSGIIGGVALTADDPAIAGFSSGPVWGIFDADGNAVVDADSVISFEFSKDWEISKFPVSPNSFGSYNKVERPYEARLTLTKGGSQQDRSDFINALDAAEASIALFTVSTPEVSYADVDVVHVDYARRADHGATLIIAEVHLEQVRQSAVASFSNTKVPQASGAVNGGTVQPGTPSAAQRAAAAGGAT